VSHRFYSDEERAELEARGIRRCEATFGPFRCTLASTHEGEHQSLGPPPDNAIAAWPRKPTDAPQADSAEGKA
jgi:hypothetical protein